MTDRAELLNKREAELVRIVDALRAVWASDEWSTLKTYVFDGLVEKLGKQLRQEAEKPELNNPAIYRLQGQMMWAKKYSNLESLAESFRSELTTIRLNPPTERDIAPDSL